MGDDNFSGQAMLIYRKGIVFVKDHYDRGFSVLVIWSRYLHASV